MNVRKWHSGTCEVKSEEVMTSWPGPLWMLSWNPQFERSQLSCMKSIHHATSRENSASQSSVLSAIPGWVPDKGVEMSSWTLHPSRCSWRGKKPQTYGPGWGTKVIYSHSVLSSWGPRYHGAAMSHPHCALPQFLTHKSSTHRKKKKKTKLCYITKFGGVLPINRWPEYMGYNSMSSLRLRLDIIHLSTPCRVPGRHQSCLLNE